MLSTIIEFYICIAIIAAYVTGTAILIWALKATGAAAWLAKTWLGELTRALWDPEY